MLLGFVFRLATDKSGEGSQQNCLKLSNSKVFQT